MKKLVLTEKPSVAREIARILGCKQNVNGGIVGSEYIVTWALGHLVTLAMPEEINKEWEEWKLETLPMIPHKYETKVIKETGKQFNNVKNLMRNSEINELIIATDAGREGELVARLIIEKVGFRKPIKRLWISSMTDSAIRTGFQRLKDAREYDNLYHSAEARSIADWLVGLNITRALTCKYNAQLSAGRVQTPTLAIVVEREKEIKQFIPKTYYTYTLKERGIEFTYQVEKGDNRLFDRELAHQTLLRFQKEEYFIKSIDTKAGKELPPLLYDLGELQQEANRLYGYSPKNTLDLIQKLYEIDKYLTYPRTDSKYLSHDLYATIPDRLKNYYNSEWSPFIKNILSKPLSSSKRIFDDNRVTDHHAIIPTELKPDLSRLSLHEKRIYDLVVKRFIAAFMDECCYENQTIVIACLKYPESNFKASIKKIITPGFRELLKTENKTNEHFTGNHFVLKEKISGSKIELKQRETQAPDRYTEATLLNAMEHPGKFVESTQMKDILESTSGIGTPATRADIMERIFSAGYVILKGKTIHPTEKGMQLINLVPKALKSPQLTAEWEMRLSAIASGKEKKQQFIVDMEENTKLLLGEVLGAKMVYRHDNATKQKCPNCGSTLLEVTNKYGKSLKCMDRNCGYYKNISRNTGFSCPNCRKKLTELVAGEHSYLTCECGFKEKKESFVAKRGNKKDEMAKRDLDNYLRNQKKEIPTNNPFLDLFDKKK